MLTMTEKMLLAIAAFFGTTIVTVLVSFLYWVGVNVVDLKTDTAVVATKVEENHKMLSVLWKDFLENKNGDLAWFNVETDK